MAVVTSRETLVEYCLRNLGHPVIEVNVDDDQIDDRVDEALQMYQSYHSDSMVRSYLKYQVTADDITNEYITIPDALLYVVRILNVTAGVNSVDPLLDVEYKFRLNDLNALTNPESMISYALTKEHLAMMDMQFNGLSQRVAYSRHMNRLKIDFEWGTDIEEGQYLVLEGYQTINPETYTAVYNDQWLKKYCTALIKRQWGINTSKFEGVQLPGGVTLNGRQILEDAKEEIKELEEELRSAWELPSDFFIG